MLVEIARLFMVPIRARIDFIHNEQHADGQEVNHKNLHPKQPQKVFVVVIKQPEQGESHDGHFGDDTVAPYHTLLFFEELHK